MAALSKFGRVYGAEMLEITSINKEEGVNKGSFIIH